MKRLLATIVGCAALAVTPVALANHHLKHGRHSTVVVGGAHPTSVSVGEDPVWWGIAYTPSCGGPPQWESLCGGTGALWQPSNIPAWSQLQVCSDDLITGGWVHMTCAWYPGSPSFTNFHGGLAPDFVIRYCNRWYTTYIFVKVLETGGWKYGSTRAPGIQVRC